MPEDKVVGETPEVKEPLMDFKDEVDRFVASVFVTSGGPRPEDDGLVNLIKIAYYGGALCVLTMQKQTQERLGIIEGVIRLSALNRSVVEGYLKLEGEVLKETPTPPLIVPGKREIV